MKASEMIAAALASMENLSQFVRDDGANYFADARNTLAVALDTSRAEEAAPQAAPIDGAAVLDAVHAVGAAVAALPAPVEPVAPVDHTPDVLAAIAAVSAKVDALKPAA
ncbi:hypothetical protein E2553_43255 [Paraburkholderia dipogonis]|uniref:Uncharacterized protein n=1 Tax=Paraburkholderia dipogonis TaxID=1211383 RepID=A0A4Y8MGK1_9BURK|nr:hypothetical protein [Paraburkholderia dipogonis]TFE36548.1 hypothetical protein E2553_43255 [Paraburkholderia dipogonis]